MSRINETRKIIWHETCKWNEFVDKYGTKTNADVNVKKI